MSLFNRDYRFSYESILPVNLYRKKSCVHHRASLFLVSVLVYLCEHCYRTWITSIRSLIFILPSATTNSFIYPSRESLLKFSAVIKLEGNTEPLEALYEQYLPFCLNVSSLVSIIDIFFIHCKVS